MILSWWALMGLMGLLMGAFAAWSLGAMRVFMQTIALPLAILVTRLAFPLKDSKWYLGYVVLDLVIVYVAAFIGDYLLGLGLGRSDREGFRKDPVGH